MSGRKRAPRNAFEFLTPCFPHFWGDRLRDRAFFFSYLSQLLVTKHRGVRALNALLHAAIEISDRVVRYGFDRRVLNNQFVQFLQLAIDRAASYELLADDFVDVPTERKFRIIDQNKDREVKFDVVPKLNGHGKLLFKIVYTFLEGVEEFPLNSLYIYDLPDQPEVGLVNAFVLALWIPGVKLRCWVCIARGRNPVQQKAAWLRYFTSQLHPNQLFSIPFEGFRIFLVERLGRVRGVNLARHEFYGSTCAVYRGYITVDRHGVATRSSFAGSADDGDSEFQRPTSKIPLDGQVAVKLFFNCFQQRTGALLDGAEREFGAFSAIDHPNVVHYYGMGVCEVNRHLLPDWDQPFDTKSLYYVIEYIPGANLDAMLQSTRHHRNHPTLAGAVSSSALSTRAGKGRITTTSELHTHGDVTAGMNSLKDKLLIAIQVLHALQCLHDHNIAHRDVKPDNILVSSDLRAVLIDYSEFTTPIAQEYYPTTTRRGGAPLFQPPEIRRPPASGSAVFFDKADVFSMACVLHVIFNGRPPYKDTKTTTQPGRGVDVDNYRDDDIPLLGMAPSEEEHAAVGLSTSWARAASGERVPMSLQVVVRRMLSRDPARRPSAIQAARCLMLILFWELAGGFGEARTAAAEAAVRPVSMETRLRDVRDSDGELLRNELLAIDCVVPTSEDAAPTYFKLFRQFQEEVRQFPEQYIEAALLMNDMLIDHSAVVFNKLPQAEHSPANAAAAMSTPAQSAAAQAEDPVPVILDPLEVDWVFIEPLDQHEGENDNGDHIEPLPIEYLEGTMPISVILEAQRSQGENGEGDVAVAAAQQTQ